MPILKNYGREGKMALLKQAIPTGVVNDGFKGS
jgi:hypothetical protein